MVPDWRYWTTNLRAVPWRRISRLRGRLHLPASKSGSGSSDLTLEFADAMIVRDDLAAVAAVAQIA